ncbi:hypothetical protein EK904_011404 [Melospiza melodia maxima]|nr:hypothetical protein EK904_011404 [Melospiza melodia maxima]
MHTSSSRVAGRKSSQLWVQVEKLAKYLDPNDLGRINFKDFCHGVFAIKGCEELLKDVLSPENSEPQHYQPQYVDYYYQESLRVGIAVANPGNSC